MGGVTCFLRAPAAPAGQHTPEEKADEFSRSQRSNGGSFFHRKSGIFPSFHARGHVFFWAFSMAVS